MAGSRFAQIVAGFAVLFVVSLGAGYAVGAQVRGPAAETAASGTPPPSEPAVSTSDPSSIPPVTAPDPGAATPDTAAAPTTTAAPAPTRDHPLRVVLAGDSVMAGLAPAVKAAWGADADVRFVLTPSILRDPAVRFTWDQQLEQFDPEVVVMFVGTWESGVVRGEDGLSVSDPRWRARYEQEILDPWVQLITSKGASVVWIGNPVVRNDDANQLFGVLNGAFRDLPARWPSVSYVDANPSLNGTATGYHDVVTGIGGLRFRTRQTDGLHLCPDGAALLGRVVVQDVDAAVGLTPRSGWEDGDWREDAVYPEASCPPIG